MYCIYNGLSETGDVGEETLEWNVARLAQNSLCVSEIGTFEYLNIRFLIIDCWLLIVLLNCYMQIVFLNTWNVGWRANPDWPDWTEDPDWNQLRNTYTDFTHYTDYLFCLDCLIVFYLIINRALFSFVLLLYCYYHYCYYYIIIFIKTIVFTINCICFYYCQFSPPSNAEPRTSLNILTTRTRSTSILAIEVIGIDCSAPSWVQGRYTNKHKSVLKPYSKTSLLVLPAKQPYSKSIPTVFPIACTSPSIK